MSQHEQVPEPPRGKESNEPREASRSEPEGELGFDDLPLAGKGRAGQTPFVHTLQKRAGSALDQRIPECLGVGADRREQPDSGHPWPPAGHRLT